MIFCCKIHVVSSLPLDWNPNRNHSIHHNGIPLTFFYQRRSEPFLFSQTMFLFFLHLETTFSQSAGSTMCKKRPIREKYAPLVDISCVLCSFCSCDSIQQGAVLQHCTCYKPSMEGIVWARLTVDKHSCRAFVNCTVGSRGEGDWLARPPLSMSRVWAVHLCNYLADNSGISIVLWGS